MRNLKFRLIVMNFLEFAVWGAYLTCMGAYLAGHGMGGQIGYFYAVQGFVSLFMPALVGIVADRFIPAQKVYGICHFIAGAFMLLSGWYALSTGDAVQFGTLFTLYTVSVAFYMPTIGLANSVAFSALTKAGMDTVKDFPPIRVFGTVGFICSMLFVDFAGFQNNYNQFLVSGALSLVLCAYAFTLPDCPVTKGDGKSRSMVDVLGLRAFTLFKDKRMAIFFIFSMLLGVSLQITNGFANPFIQSFGAVAEYAETFAVKHANALISLSQTSETLCILLIPFCMKRFGIKNVMLIAMVAWVLRFGLFGLGNPSDGVWMFVLSMIVYGVAFDFFNVSGGLFVDKECDPSVRASGQGLFMLMTNGLGATVGTLAAGEIVNHFCAWNENGYLMSINPGGWQNAWFIFAGFALVVAIAFMFLFKYKHEPEAK